MNDYIKNELIKSIVEADLIIKEINNEYWNNIIIVLALTIIFLFLIYEGIIKYYIEKKKRI